jgi:hypothetical protein
MKFLSSKVHTIIGLIVGMALLFAPELFGFSDNQTATMIPIYVGIFIIISELVTTSVISPIKLVPMRMHLVLDWITGAFLALSPWLFGFADQAANVWVPHLIVGILVIGYALVTNPNVESEKSIAE